MIQKSALIGSSEGPWVACFGLRNLRLKVASNAPAQFKVEVKNKGPAMNLKIEFDPSAEDLPELPNAQFIRLSVLQGDAGSIIVHLLADEVKRAISRS